MCEYIIDKTCTILNQDCPWVYYCNKINGYKELSGKPKRCKVLDKIKPPDGFYKVEFERHGYLYVVYMGETLKLKNIFNVVPQFVSLRKRGKGFEIMDMKGIQE